MLAPADCTARTRYGMQTIDAGYHDYLWGARGCVSERQGGHATRRYDRSGEPDLFRGPWERGIPGPQSDRDADASARWDRLGRTRACYPEASNQGVCGNDQLS